MSNEDQEKNCREHSNQLTELKCDVKEVKAVLPDIKILLERSVHLQEQMREASDTNKEIFTSLRNLTEDLTRIKSDEITGLKIKTQGIDGRLKVLEESRKGILQIISPVWTGVILGGLTAILTLVIMHGIGGAK